MQTADNAKHDGIKAAAVQQGFRGKSLGFWVKGIEYRVISLGFRVLRLP